MPQPALMVNDPVLYLRVPPHPRRLARGHCRLNARVDFQGPVYSLSSEA